MIFSPCPWSGVLSDGGLVEATETCESVSIPGQSNPRILLNWFQPDADEDAPNQKAPEFEGKHRMTALPISFPFKYAGWKQAYAVPYDNGKAGGIKSKFETTAMHNGLALIIVQNEVISRPDDKQKDKLSTSLDGWVKWMMGGFRKLVHASHFSFPLEEKRIRIRRAWPAVLNTLFEEHSQDPPLHLVVELSRDNPLSEAFYKCSLLPRRVLKRIRANQRVSKIQQMDAACIRDYARRPGRTPRQKAGSRQELLGILRTENMDTHENRVLCWTLEEIDKLSKDYCMEFAAFSGNRILKEVNRYAQHARSWRSEEDLGGVAPRQIQHPAVRNYPLQHDRHYRTVYGAYQKIFEHEVQLDDAWSWLRVTWSQTVRLILYGLLTDQSDSSNGSTISLLSAPISGCWVQFPFAPGPLSSRQQSLEIYDSDDIRADGWSLKRLKEGSLFPGCKYAGCTGADSVLVLKDKDRTSRQIFVWALMSPAGAQHAELLQEVQGVLAKYRDASRLDPACELGGLIVAIDPAGRSRDTANHSPRSCQRWGATGNEVNASVELVSVFPDIYTAPPELKEDLFECCKNLELVHSLHEKVTA